MNKIIGIIVKPATAVKHIAEEEPLFSGFLIFSVCVIIANFPLVKSFMVEWRAGVFNVIALIFIWGGALMLVNLIITGIQKLINPVTSSLLDSERFRKLGVVELYIAVILVFRPLLSVLFSPVVVWVIISAWAIILAIAAVCHLWNVTEIKSALSVVSGVLIVFMGARMLDPGNEYVFSGDFKDFKEEIADRSLPRRYGIEGLSEIQYIAENRENIAEAARQFTERKPHSPVVPYAMLVRASVLLKIGQKQEASEIFRVLVSGSDSTPAPVYKSAMVNLSRLLEDREYNLLPIDLTPTKWRRVLQLWRLPLSLSYYRGNMDRIGTIKEMIENEPIPTLKTKLEPVIRNFKDTDFMDDIVFWAGRRYEKEGLYEVSLDYYRKVIKMQYPSSHDRIAVESIIGYISSLSGLKEILIERYRRPEAFLAAAKIYKKGGRIKDSLDKINLLTRQYPSHGLSAEALAIEAEINEEKENFKEAVELYERIIDRYPLSDVVPAVEEKKRILAENLSNSELLAAYVNGLKKWRQGRQEEAIEIYKGITEKFPRTRLARSLQYGIAGYYRAREDYMQAVQEARKGYEKFPDSEYGFESALLVAEVLAEDLNYYRSAVNWLQDIIQQYPSEFKSQVSGITAADAAFRAAKISRNNLRDYHLALQIYDFIFEKYSNPRILSKALFEKALIQEEEYRHYSEAVSTYKRIISEFPGTSHKDDAERRLNEIYQQGVRYLDRIY